ncbi:DUF2946 family protein [Limnohabitans sp. Rim8]|uniref:DUF2946 family protein n=1 Tax=Limnohabitans sp. Rim8 TaxID=1100718 RepID=UPI0025E6542C|nr:DUF2946 family protein [Limnohabitans sp. Rim8]
MSFPRARLPRWLNILLVGALLWAPLWGHLHGIEHGIEPGTRQALTTSAELHEAHAHALHAQDDHRHEGHSDALGHEADSDLCRVLDHLSHAERLIATNAPGLAPMVAMAALKFRADSHSDQHLWSPAQARAPPALI